MDTKLSKQLHPLQLLAYAIIIFAAMKASSAGSEPYPVGSSAGCQRHAPGKLANQAPDSKRIGNLLYNSFADNCNSPFGCHNCRSNL